MMVIIDWESGGGSRDSVAIFDVAVGEEVHFGSEIVKRWRRGMVDLEGYISGWRRRRRGFVGVHDVVVGVVVMWTKLFPLGVVSVFRERVENNWLMEEEAPNWIWIHGESTTDHKTPKRERERDREWLRIKRERERKREKALKSL